MKSVVALILVLFTNSVFASETVEIFDPTSCDLKQTVLNRSADISNRRLGEVMDRVLNTYSLDRILADHKCALQFYQMEKEKAAQAEIDGTDEPVAIIVGGYLGFAPWDVAVAMQTMFM